MNQTTALSIGVHSMIFLHSAIDLPVAYPQAVGDLLNRHHRFPTPQIGLFSAFREARPSPGQGDLGGGVPGARRGVLGQPIGQRVELVGRIGAHEADLNPIAVPEIVAVEAEQETGLVQVPAKLG